MAALRRPDGSLWLAYATSSHHIRFVDADTRRPVGVVSSSTRVVRALATVSQADDADWLASSGNLRPMQLWDPADRQEIRQFGHNARVRAMVAITQPGRTIYVASAGDDRDIRIWDPTTGELTHHLIGHSDYVLALATPSSPGKDRWLASGSSDQSIRIWDLSTGEQRHHLAPGLGSVWALAALPQRSGPALLASACRDGGVQVWNPDTGQLERTLGQESTIVRALGALPQPDGSCWLAAGTTDGRILIWDDLAETQPRWERSVHRGWVVSMLHLPARAGRGSHGFLASGGQDGTIQLWDLTSGHLETVELMRFAGFNDGTAPTDLFGREPLADVVSDILQYTSTSPNPLPPEPASANTAQAGPSIITIEGVWGSGKSTTMRHIQQRLLRANARHERSANQKNRSRRLTVGRALRLSKRADEPEPSHSHEKPTQISAWFNPWAHQSSEQIWAGLALRDSDKRLRSHSERTCT